MRKNRLTEVVSSSAFRTLCRVIVGAIFIYAAVGKIRNPQEFADAVAAFKILPLASINVFAILLPWVELIAGLSLLTGMADRSGGLIVTALTAVFLVAVASAMARGLDIECGCFTLSHAHSKVGWALVVRDIVLLALCLPTIARKGTAQC